MTTQQKAPPAGRVKLKRVRIAFIKALWKAEAYKDGEPKFSASFLIPKTDTTQLAAIEKAIATVAANKWGAKATKTLQNIRGNPNKFTFRDGDTQGYDGYDGCMSIRASNKVRVPVKNADTSPLTEADGVIYAGCYVNAIVDFFAYDNSGAGISASLMGVQFAGDGDAFAGGGVASDEDFEDVSEGADAVADLTS